MSDLRPGSRRLLTVGCLCALLAAGCSSQRGTLDLASFEESGVRVSIFLENDGGNPVLAAQFAPLDPGFHFYSIDLPEEGLDGAGRPTRLDLPPDSPIQAGGSLSADVEAFLGTDLLGTLPRYPDGPVTLRLPVALPPGSCSVETAVLITYMTCSGISCRQPVLERPVEIRIPCADSFILP